MKYPTVEEIIEANAKVLKEITRKKGDKSETLSKIKIQELLEKVENSKGDVYDKTVLILKGIIQAHAFASGNRRTAFAVCIDFLRINGAKSNISENTNPKVFQGIRENFYSDLEIRNFIINGDIHDFKRK